MKSRRNLLVTILVFVFSAGTVYAGGIGLEGYFGESNGIDLEFTFGKNNNWVFGPMLENHSVKYTYKSDDYNPYSYGYSTPISEEVDSSTYGFGLFFGYQRPFFFLNFDNVAFGLEPVAKLFLNYNTYYRRSSSSYYSSDNSKDNSRKSAANGGLVFDLNIIARVRRFDITVGYRGAFNILETFSELNNTPFKSAFSISSVFHFSGNGSSVATSIMGSSDDYDNVRILPVPGTNFPAYQKVVE